MRDFVTGGSGFVGGRLIERLVSDGRDVRALARSERAATAVAALGAEPVRGSLDDIDGLRAGMEGCERVFHAAARVGDWGPREEFLRVNVRGTEHVLAAARAAGARRVVHVSTEAVLVGGPPIVDADETWPLPERPLGLYPWSKGLAERAVQAANGQGLETVIVRPRLVWGRGDTSVLPRIVEAVRRGRFAWISGGRFPTSTAHVSNVAHGLVLAGDRSPGGETYFVTDGPPVEMRAFLTALLRTQGVEPPDRNLPRPLARAMAAAAEAAWRLLPVPGDPPLTRTAVRLIGETVTVRDDKARRELGYAPVVSREDGLREMAEAA